MIVMLMPESPEVANVIVNGRVEAQVGKVEPAEPWEHYSGEMREGPRWVPVGVKANVIGPGTTNEAALLALALAGFDPEASMKALGFGAPSGKNGAA